jgi:methylated-DNA-protein-cysteine methyltransferase related protein
MRTAKRAQPGSERDLVRERVLATVDSIPRGRVASYGDIAREAGLPRRARLVGRILSQLPPHSGLPWHRVVNAQGGLSPRGDGGSLREQRRRLAREGVRFDARGRVDLARHRWRPA